MQLTNNVLVFDGNSLCYVAHHGHEEVLGVDGEPVHAISGALALMCQFIEKHPKHTPLVLWDCDESNWRKDIYPAYKAQRTENEEQRQARAQIARQRVHLRQALTHCDILQMHRPRYEADDLAFEICNAALFDKVVLVSADTDWLQLLTNSVSWQNCRSPYDHIGSTEQLLAKTKASSGLQYIEAKILAGDASDNLPGLPDIGPVRALSLIEQFGSASAMALDVQALVSAKQKCFRELASNPDETQATVARNFQLMSLSQAPEPQIDAAFVLGQMCEFSLGCLLDEVGLSTQARNTAYYARHLERQADELAALVRQLTRRYPELNMQCALEPTV